MSISEKTEQHVFSISLEDWTEALQSEGALATYQNKIVALVIPLPKPIPFRRNATVQDIRAAYLERESQ